MSVTKFTRGFVKTCLEYKINRINCMRDYDIMTDHERGLSLEQLGIKYGISKQAIHKIVHKLQ